ncbi:hypothetical protein QQF64_025857 [Cirrhinus molitorella]|uniref:Peptidase S1 domain-containing protein n=1 Tax=Cirrhinus molitorella TaxID=172907 RepID=A0ABR3NQI1_9TELE
MYFGRLNQSGSNPYETSRTVRQVIQHPNFNLSTADNDIALVQLSSSVTFSDYIKPVCLAAAGSVFAAGTAFPDILQEVMIPIVNNSACNNSYAEVKINITSNMICAALLNQGGKGACQGDSGGPMVSRKSSQWIQSGIVSFGEECADPIFPTVFARISQYQDWIKSYTGSNPPGFVAFNSASNYNFGSTPNLLLFPLSLIFSIIPFTFSLFLSF